MKFNYLSLILIIAPIILSACLNKDVATTPDNDYVVLNDKTDDPSQSTTQSAVASENQYIAINTDYGQVVIELFSQITPDTVKNIVDKINSNYYDGLVFHRVVPGFVVQGGDPTGTGSGGDKIKSELNQIPFKTGSLGLFLFLRV